MERKVAHLLYCPWTGLGLYNGFRGNRWLKNRIQVFNQFVLPSLLNQTNKNFALWCSWRHEERSNPIVLRFMAELNSSGLSVVHTFAGLCFWDDKYPDEIARERLITSLHNSLGHLTDVVGEAEDILMTIQPSDDCYKSDMVERVQKELSRPDLQAFGYSRGYIINYATKEVCYYNPTTNPPFYTIKFPREIFLDPLKHMEYTGPYKSHEYVGEKLKYERTDERGFCVGTHGENVSTVFNHPFKGDSVDGEVLKQFGIYDAPPLKINFSLRKRILRRLPFSLQKKIRYWFGERLWNKIYEFLRS